MNDTVNSLEYGYFCLLYIIMSLHPSHKNQLDINKEWSGEKGPAPPSDQLQGHLPHGTKAFQSTPSMTKGTNLEELLPDVAFQEVLNKLGVFCPVMCFFGPFLQELREVGNPAERPCMRTSPSQPSMCPC